MPVSRIPNSFSRLGSLGLALAAVALTGAGQGQGSRIDRPEGYLEFEGDAGRPSGKGSYTVVPSSGDRAAPAAIPGGEDESPAVLQDQYPPPPPRPTPREACQPAAARFSSRLAALRGNATDGGAEPLDPAVQRAMFGRTALHATGSDPDQAVPELTWDDELKELYRAYQKCLKAAAQRAR
jgi:hypothetical protein